MIHALFDVPRRMLPEIRPSSDTRTYGTTHTDGPFGGEVPLTAALGDHQAAEGIARWRKAIERSLDWVDVT